MLFLLQLKVSPTVSHFAQRPAGNGLLIVVVNSASKKS